MRRVGFGEAQEPKPSVIRHGRTGIGAAGWIIAALVVIGGIALVPLPLGMVFEDVVLGRASTTSQPFFNQSFADQSLLNHSLVNQFFDGQVLAGVFFFGVIAAIVIAKIRRAIRSNRGADQNPKPSTAAQSPWGRR